MPGVVDLGSSPSTTRLAISDAAADLMIVRSHVEGDHVADVGPGLEELIKSESQGIVLSIWRLYSLFLVQG